MSDEKYTSLEYVVHIIESPKPVELLNGRREGVALQEALQVAKIRSELHTVVNETMLKKCIGGIIAKSPGEGPILKLPVLHISAHGNEKCLGLTDGSDVNWKRLGELIEPLNEALGGLLQVFMSTCHGFSALAMAHNLNSKPPFYALVGPNEKISWPQGNLAFHVAYYHILHRDETDLSKVVNAMNAALGVEKPLFEAAMGEEVRKHFQQKVVKIIKRLAELRRQKLAAEAS